MNNKKKIVSFKNSIKFNNSVSLLELIQGYKQKNLDKNNKKQNNSKMITKNLFLNKFLSKSSRFKNISNETINKLISSTDMGIKYDSSLINSFSNYNINNIKPLSHTTSHKKKLFLNNNNNNKSIKQIFYNKNLFFKNTNKHKKIFSNDFINFNNNNKNSSKDKILKKTNSNKIQSINPNILNLKNSKKNINFNLTNINNNKIAINDLKKYKRSSLIDQLMFKMTNPDECIEEYGGFNNNIEYKYTKFKKQLIKKKNKVDKIILKLKLEQRKADEEIKRYNPTLLIRQYHLKTQYNYAQNNDNNKNKIFTI